MKRKIAALLAIGILAAALPALRGWAGSPKAFPHDTHLGADLACDDCHKGVPDSKDLSEGIGYDLAACANCHEAGDLLLVEVANRLRNCVRDLDTVGRFGGDEFVVMLNEIDTDKAKARAHAGVRAGPRSCAVAHLAAPSRNRSVHGAGASRRHR
jgi:hypothetical protein